MKYQRFIHLMLLLLFIIHLCFVYIHKFALCSAPLQTKLLQKNSKQLNLLRDNWFSYLQMMFGPDICLLSSLSYLREDIWLRINPLGCLKVFTPCVLHSIGNGGSWRFKPSKWLILINRYKNVSMLCDSDYFSDRSNKMTWRRDLIC